VDRHPRSEPLEVEARRLADAVAAAAHLGLVVDQVERLGAAGWASPVRADAATTPNRTRGG
jgi:hypothetical protein